MALPAEGPCEAWATWDEATACVDDATKAKLDAIPEAVKTSLIEQVSGILYNFSGKRFPGICTATRSPCVHCSCSRWPCCCARSDRLDLGREWSVASIESVIVDGVELAPGEHYQVNDWRYLVRLDGGTWPRCADDIDPDAFSVTWSFGREIPAGGRAAAALFVAEAAKPCAGLKCQIPQRVVSVQREGVNYTIIDSFRMLEDGKTGIFMVDAWLMSLRFGDRASAGMLDPAGECESFTAIDTAAEIES